MLTSALVSFVDDYTCGNAIALCNSNKKMISRADANRDDFYAYAEVAASKYQPVVYYGVKKNTVYYIRVKGASTKKEANNQHYIGTVKWTNFAVKGIKYGKKKRMAVALKKNKVKNGVFLAGNRKAQWYKISTKKTINRIILTANKNCGTIKAKVYYKRYGRWTSTIITGSRSGSYYYLKRYSGKIKKAYVKVYPDYKSSGAYKLKWK